MDLRLTTTREIAELKGKIDHWGNIAKRLRITQNCNADYHNYKEIEGKIVKRKERLEYLIRSKENSC